jgi:hypothetical protein
MHLLYFRIDVWFSVQKLNEKATVWSSTICSCFDDIPLCVLVCFGCCCAYGILRKKMGMDFGANCCGCLCGIPCVYGWVNPVTLVAARCLHALQDMYIWIWPATTYMLQHFLCMHSARHIHEVHEFGHVQQSHDKHLQKRSQLPPLHILNMHDAVLTDLAMSVHQMYQQRHNAHQVRHEGKLCAGCSGLDNTAMLCSMPRNQAHKTISVRR